MLSIFKTDVEKAILTCSLFVCSFFVGLMDNVLGVILLDVMEMTDVSFSVAASYLIALDIGEIIGSVVLGILRQKSDPFIAMSVSLGVIAVSAAVIPWCTIYTTLFITCIIIGTPIGFMRPFLSGELTAIWGKEGSRLMVILYTLRKIGTVFSLLFMSIFLSPTNDVSQGDSGNNVTDISMHNTSRNLYMPLTSIASLELIGALLCCSLYIWFKRYNLSDLYVSNGQEDSKTIRSDHKIVTYILVVSISGLINAFNYGFNKFVASFIVQKFNTSRREAAYVSALYNGIAIVGRLSSLFAMHFFSNFALSFFSLFLMVTGSVCLYLCSFYNAYLIMVLGCVVLIALGSYPTSSLLPVVITEYFFPVTRVTANVICFAGTLTDMLQSLLKGRLMEELGAIQLNVIMVVESFVIFILFALLFCLKLRVSRTATETETTIILKQ